MLPSLEIPLRLRLCCLVLYPCEVRFVKEKNKGGVNHSVHRWQYYVPTVRGVFNPSTTVAGETRNPFELYPLRSLIRLIIVYTYDGQLSALPILIVQSKAPSTGWEVLLVFNWCPAVLKFAYFPVCTFGDQFICLLKN